MPEKSLGAAIDEIVGALSALPEGARATAIRAACDHLSLTVPSIEGSRLGGDLPKPPIDFGGASGASGTIHHPTDIRTLKEQKQPGSAQEMACVMAYYLQSLAPQAERKTAVSAADITKYFAQANYPLPKAPSQVLVDTKLAGYFDAAERGTYKLNPVGYNLVVHSLPREAGAGKPKAKSAKAKSAKRSASVRRGKTRGK